MLINIKMSKFKTDELPFLQLQYHVIDVQNMVAYSTVKTMAHIWRVIKTPGNDRRRARSQQKGKGFDFNFVCCKLKDEFAREAGEFGIWWSIEFHGGNKENHDWPLPTPRQVLAGLQHFFEQ